MKRLLLPVLLLGLAVTASAGAGHGAGPRTVVESTRLVEGGNIRISVSIGTPVAAGHALRVTYRIENVSKQPRKIQLGYDDLWFVVHSADGTRYDTRVPLRGISWPYIPPKTLRAGESVTEREWTLRERWSGPLRITPGWARTPFSSVHVSVTTPGALPSPHAAVAAVVATSGHLLDDCAPTVPGVAVTGRIVAPRRSAPPLHVRCSVALTRERGFYDAQLLVETTPAPRGVRLRRPYELFTWPRPWGNATAIAWEFVVTRAGAISVDSTSVESSRSGAPMAPDWQWTTRGWQGQPGGSKCGGTGGGGGGFTGPLVEFVSICPR